MEINFIHGQGNRSKTIMTNLRVLTTQEPGEWMGALDHCAPFDFYHLPQYHVLAEQENEGKARLFLYTEGTYTIALPLLLREVEHNWRDATSVYGYAGPVCSHRAIPASVVARFHSALTERLRQLGVVNVFSRLHPFFAQRPLLAGLGECQPMNRTVSIDLTLDPAQQRFKYRKGVKRGINKLRKRGLTVFRDVNGIHLDDFVRIYHETMYRVEAVDQFFFSPAYFKLFWETLRSRTNLFVCLDAGRPICAGLFMTCHGIVQYHLGGTLNEALKLAPMKLLVDEVRLWGSAQGYHTLHLGGGTSADPDDSLLHYKLGFSDETHEFSAWRWILCPDVHDRLCAAKAQWNDRHELQAAHADFFPAYRSPTVPRVLATQNAIISGELLQPKSVATGGG
jgi:hypothetical protein